LAAGAGFPMREYQMESLRQMASLREMMASLDARMAADANRDRTRAWTKVERMAIHQTATPWSSYADRARGWFGQTPEYKVPEKRVKPGNWVDIREIRKLWK